ncbi:VTT domain-containing protein [Flavobacterium sp. WC2421]|uniref:DedA family protein n=1 Tax=Flavobacterium sp. WC2421 TaxID=3234138 RepID=UPI003464F083
MKLNMYGLIFSYNPLSYFGIFIWFLFLDQLTPIPEEVTLLSIGYIAQHHVINPYYAGLSAFCGLTIIDNLFYWLAFSGNKLIDRFKNKIGEKMQKKYIDGMEKHSVRTLLLLSFIPKIRFFSPIFAGLFHVKWRTFFIVNGFGTLIFITLYIAAVMLFHNSLEYLLKELEFVRHFIFVLLMIVITIVLFFKFRKKHQ